MLPLLAWPYELPPASALPLPFLLVLSVFATHAVLVVRALRLFGGSPVIQRIVRTVSIAQPATPQRSVAAAGADGADGADADDAETEEAAIASLKSTLEQRGVHVADRPGESVHQLLRRFLHARGMSVHKAADFLEADITWRARLRSRHPCTCSGGLGIEGARVLWWREEHRADAMGQLPPEAVLGCDTSWLQAILPHAMGGEDKLGRPLVFKHFGGQCQLKQMLKVTTMEQLCEYNVWLNELYTRRLAQLGSSQWVVVVDAKGWYPGLFDRTAFTVLKSMAKAAKARLLERADISQLPSQYAGTGPPLQPWPDRSGFPA